VTVMTCIVSILVSKYTRVYVFTKKHPTTSKVPKKLDADKLNRYKHRYSIEF